MQRIRGRLRIWTLGLATATGLLACGNLPPPRHQPTSAPTPSPGDSTVAVARVFLQDMVDQDYPAQRQLLAPIERAAWPSPAARSAMLAAKFSGPSHVVGFSLGRPAVGMEWASPENPRVHVASATEVPAAVTVSRPAALAPPGVAALCLHTDLVLEGPGSLPATAGYLVVGEGPAALEAPVIAPAALQLRTASAPILIYHLVGPYPDRPQYASQYSYELDYGLTVPPDQFSAETQYLVANGSQAITIYRLADYLLYDLPLPSRPVVITFDDGFANECQYALPVLEADGLTATFFPCTGLIGVRNGEEECMPAAKVRSLSRMGSPFRTTPTTTARSSGGSPWPRFRN